MSSPHRPSTGDTYLSESTANVAPGFGGLLRSSPIVSGDFSALDKWRTGLKRVRSGAGNARAIAIGDSTLGGWPTSFVDRATQQWAANRLTTTYPGAMYATDLTKYTDSRVTMGGGWLNALAGSGGPARQGLWLGSAGVGPSTFGPVECDRFQIWYLNAGVGTFSYSIDGGAGTVVNVTAAGGVGAVTTGAVTAGTHTLSINTVTGGGVFLFAVEPRTGTAGLYVSRCGMGATYSTLWNDASLYYSSSSLMFTTLQADLYVIMLTVGDNNVQTLLPTYKSNLEALVDLGKTYGSVVLAVAPRPLMPDAYPLKYDQYISVVEGVRDSKTVGLINFANHFDPLDRSLYMEDTLHPSVGAQAEMALILSQALMP